MSQLPLPPIARRTLPFLVFALGLASGACGGARSRKSTRLVAAAGPADIPAMRALLARYSPNAHRIVTTYEALPTKYVFGPSTFEVTHSKGFADYFHDGAPENVVDHMNTAVHEVYHAHAALRAYSLLQESQTPRGLGAEAVDLEQPLLVSYSPTFPARDMAQSFPADARTSRYQTYVVSPDSPTQSTQQDGVFGLLDELAAYYHGARTQFEFWPWVRDEAPANADEQLLVNYVARYHEMWVPLAEFQLFILHYVLHARAHRPDVYQGLVANQSFRRAFVATIDAYSALLASAAELEPTVHAFARSRGVDANLDQVQLTFDGAPFTIRDDHYPAVLRHLASAPYQAILAELR